MAGYQGCVSNYLSSKLGRGASPHIAAQLYELPYQHLGLGESPNHAQLHVTRAFLEATQEGSCEQERGQQPSQ